MWILLVRLKSSVLLTLITNYIGAESLRIPPLAFFILFFGWGVVPVKLVGVPPLPHGTPIKTKMYIVFQDSLSGFKHIRALDGDNLAEVVQSITEGYRISQNFMYFIYKEHEMNVPIVGTKFNTYIRVKAVAGSYVKEPYTNSHQYAMTHNSSTAWFFTDNLFE